MMMFLWVGCTRNDQKENNTNNISSDETNKILVVYFSWSSSGNTEKLQM